MGNEYRISVDIKTSLIIVIFNLQTERFEAVVALSAAACLCYSRVQFNGGIVALWQGFLWHGLVKSIYKVFVELQYTNTARSQSLNVLIISFQHYRLRISFFFLA